MRVFLTACLAVVVLAIGAVFLLGSAQQPSGYAYSTTAARPEMGWVWRQPVETAPQSSAMSKTSEASDGNCRSAGVWTYIVTDFRGTRTADPVCRL